MNAVGDGAQHGSYPSISGCARAPPTPEPASGDDCAISRWFRSYSFADVHDDLIIGAYPLDAEDVAVIGRLGVTRLLNLVEDSEYRPGQREAVEAALATTEIDEVRMSLVDFGHLPSTDLERAVQTVTGWLQAGERVYVHCRAGWQRSAAVAAGAVAIREGIEIAAALQQVQSRKPSANPLPHQREELLRWWDERQNRSSAQPPPGEPVIPRPETGKVRRRRAAGEP